MTNLELWDSIRAAYPNFSNHTSKGTAEMFTAAGFEKMRDTNPDVLNDFWDLSMRVFLQSINVSDAKDRLNEQDFGEVYEQSAGGYIQRLAVHPVKPVTPAYKKLMNGKSVDPYVVNKPEMTERFFKQNFDYQALLTIPDEFQFKQIFIQPNGMELVMGALMRQLENAYIIQKFVNKKEAINAGLNSTSTPLISTQKVDVSIADINAPTEDELINLILAIKDTVSAMTVGASSSAFNAMQFPTVQDVSRLRLLVHPKLRNRIEVLVARNSFNAQTLNLPIKIVEIDDFGGLEAYKEDSYETKLYPVYNDLGAVLGYSETEGQTGQENVTVEEVDVKWKNPNKGVHAVIADKGWIFESIQNPYRVEPLRNPRGLYTQYFSSCPNGAILVDALYNVVEIKNPD